MSIRTLECRCTTCKLIPIPIPMSTIPRLTYASSLPVVEHGHRPPFSIQLFQTAVSIFLQLYLTSCLYVLHQISSPRVSWSFPYFCGLMLTDCHAMLLSILLSQSHFDLLRWTDTGFSTDFLHRMLFLTLSDQCIFKKLLVSKHDHQLG